MTRRASSLTAWGRARPLDVAFADAVAADHDGVVQLSIGTRPVEDPFMVLANSPVELVAHHTVPLGRSRVLRPEADPTTMIEALEALGITRYSAHPPARRFADWDEMWSWARTWHRSCRRAGISFALETMYPAMDPSDQGHAGGWHLDAPHRVERFLDACAAEGWESPLVVDGAHLHIGLTAGVWSHDDIYSLVQRCCEENSCAEAHVSSNDGVRDKHQRAGLYPHVDMFVEDLARNLAPALIVDEGRV